MSEGKNSAPSKQEEKQQPKPSITLNQFFKKKSPEEIEQERLQRLALGPVNKQNPTLNSFFQKTLTPQKAPQPVLCKI